MDAQSFALLSFDQSMPAAGTAVPLTRVPWSSCSYTKQATATASLGCIWVTAAVSNSEDMFRFGVWVFSPFSFLSLSRAYHSFFWCKYKGHGFQYSGWLILMFEQCDQNGNLEVPVRYVLIFLMHHAASMVCEKRLRGCWLPWAMPLSPMMDCWLCAR